MCSLESELESQMGEFHVKMKGQFLLYSRLTSSLARSDGSPVSLPLFHVAGLAGFARLCAGDQYEVRNRNTSAQTPIMRRRHITAAVSPPRLGPDAIRAATLEATRPRGSQQQADMGQ